MDSASLLGFANWLVGKGLTGARKIAKPYHTSPVTLVQTRSTNELSSGGVYQSSDETQTAQSTPDQGLMLRTQAQARH
jgi:hypothetical protein